MSEIPDIQTLLEKDYYELLALAFEHADERSKQTLVPIPEHGKLYLEPPVAPLANLPWDDYKKGQFLLHRAYRAIERRICLEWKYYEKHFDPNFQDTVQLISALCDVLASLVIGVPPVIVATLLAKRGLKTSAM